MPIHRTICGAPTPVIRGGQAASTSHAIGNTADSRLYQTWRSGSSFSYHFGVPNGNYTVTLKFAETTQTAAGRRLFGVQINGTAVLANFDVFAAAGGEFVAVAESFPVTVTNGQIAIQFTGTGTGTPLINAIAITP